MPVNPMRTVEFKRLHPNTFYAAINRVANLPILAAVKFDRGRQLLRETFDSFVNDLRRDG